MQAYSERYEKALVMATRAHRNQTRKGSDLPYAAHPVHVSVILIRHGYPEEMVIAGLLHDVAEDTDVSLAQIEADFGPVVSEVVEALTEQKQEGGRFTKNGAKRPWNVRKEEALAQLRQASPGAVAVKAADLLHNARTLAEHLRREGSSAWDHYTVGPDPVLWYYRAVAEVVRERLGTQPLTEETDQAVQELERVATGVGTA